MTVNNSSLATWAATIEAVIFASEKPIRESDLRNHLPDDMELAPLITMIHKRFDETSGIKLCQVGDSWAFRTRAEIAAHLNTRQEVERPLSRAALEVLAIIAYHQPITRAEIEEIRGISLSRGTIDILLELGWIKPRGRRRTPGRPLTWGTSPAFLDHFGLSDLADLPGLDELKASGLLRKGQVIGGFMDRMDSDENEDQADQADEDGFGADTDLLEEALMEAGLDADLDEDDAPDA